MGNVIIALPKIENSKNIQSTLRKYGIEAIVVNATGSNVLSRVEQMDYGVVVCGVNLTDMHCSVLMEYLPKHFELLIIAQSTSLSYCPRDAMTISLPCKISDIAGSVEMLLAQLDRRFAKKKKGKERTEEEKNYILNAKRILMERNNMTEEDAFRYLQKSSMDSGTNLVETAQMVIMLAFDE